MKLLVFSRSNVGNFMQVNQANTLHFKDENTGTAGPLALR